MVFLLPLLNIFCFCYIYVIYIYSLRETTILKAPCTPMFTAALCTTVRTWKQPGCPSTLWMRNEDVLHTYKGLLAIKRNEFESILVRWMNLEPVIQKEKQILYIKACLWNHEKWHWWTYLQGWNGDADVQNGLVDTVGQGESGSHGESSINIFIYTLCIYAQSCLTLDYPRDCSPSGSSVIMCKIDGQWAVAI